MPSIATVNPTTGDLVRAFEPHSEQEIEQRLQQAAEAFRLYQHLPFSKRAGMMMRAAEILESEKQKFARLMTLEMGKPLRAAVQEAEKCAVGCRFYAENAESLLADEPARTATSRSFVRYQPLGAILAVMPWNFPFWQVFRFAAPTLMAGNVALLKHASNVPQCALAIEEIFAHAGFPAGVFQTLLIGSKAVERVIDDPRIAAVSLTGSVGAGESVAQTAGRNIKKTVLELGGSDPFIVMPSANLDQAVQVAVQARVINNGQSCIAAKRFVVAQEIANQFERRFTEGMKRLKIGDPLDEHTDVGPLATAQVRDDLEDQVNRSIAAGARLLAGGKRLEGRGNFYPPTVLTDIPEGSPAHNEELFGPVASIFRAKDRNDALRIANDTTFGLGASVWTNDPGERDFFINGIQAGMIFVNGMVVSDPLIPFGGIKQSGYGRELSSFGIREFVNIKTVSICDVSSAGRSSTE